MAQSDTTPPGTDYAFQAKVAALCFLVPFAALAVWSGLDRRNTREAFVKISAVGDEPAYTKPDKPDYASPVVTFEGRPLFFYAEAAHADIPDTQMRRAGLAEGSNIMVYRCVDGAQKDWLFIKRRTDRYYRLTASPPGKK